jgi:DNA-binding transcriptional LysR family regulator
MQTFSAGQNAATVKPPSLTEDGERLNGRLREIAARLEKIGDTLHGSAPHTNRKLVAPQSRCRS